MSGEVMDDAVVEAMWGVLMTGRDPCVGLEEDLAEVVNYRLGREVLWRLLERWKKDGVPEGWEGQKFLGSVTQARREWFAAARALGECQAVRDRGEARTKRRDWTRELVEGGEDE